MANKADNPKRHWFFGPQQELEEQAERDWEAIKDELDLPKQIREGKVKVTKGPDVDPRVLFGLPAVNKFLPIPEVIDLEEDYELLNVLEIMDEAEFATSKMEVFYLALLSAAVIENNGQVLFNDKFIDQELHRFTRLTDLDKVELDQEDDVWSRGRANLMEYLTDGKSAVDELHRYQVDQILDNEPSYNLPLFHFYLTQMMAKVDGFKRAARGQVAEVTTKGILTLFLEEEQRYKARRAKQAAPQQRRRAKREM